MELFLAGYCNDYIRVVATSPRVQKQLTPLAMDEFRYRRMKSIQQSVQLSFKNACNSLVFNTQSENSFTYLLEQRIFSKEPTLRSFFVVSAFNYLIGNETSAVSQRKRQFILEDLPFIIEVLISIQYYHNHILDSKFGVRSAKNSQDWMLHASLLRSFLDDYLLAKTPQELYPEVRSLLTHVYRCVDIGQQLERTSTRYANWKEEIYGTSPVVPYLNHKECMLEVHQELTYCNALSSRTSFLRQYLERIYLTNAVFYVSIVRILERVIGKSDEGLVDFAMRFGLMKQIINDIADLVPSSVKIGTRTRLPEDAFSDLKNHNITLPIMLLLLKSPNGFTRQWLEEDAAWTPDLEKKIAEEFVSTLVVYHAMSLSRRVKKLAISKLNTDNPHFDLFEDMCAVADVNKFYRYFDKMKNRKAYRRIRKAC